jgi:hypothetical protein
MTHTLRRRHRLKAMRNLLLPPQAVLAVNLRRGLEVRLQQTRSKHDLVLAQGLLRVVHVCGAVLAVEAVDALAWDVVSDWVRLGRRR